VKRVFVYFAGIGDVVMLVPFLRRLAADGPLDLVLRDFCGDLFAAQPFVRRVWTLRHPNRGRSALGRLFAGERRRLGGRLATEGFDEVVDTTAERPVVLDWIRGWSSGAPLRLIDLPRGWGGRGGGGRPRPGPGGGGGGGGAPGRAPPANPWASGSTAWRTVRVWRPTPRSATGWAPC
jgi:hypothetical protein